MLHAKLLQGTVIILDLDGTLVDSAPDLADAMNVVLQSEGLAPIPEAEVRHLTGHGAKKLLTRAFNLRGISEVPSVQMQRHLDLFIQHYKVHLTNRSRPFPGATDTLDELKSAGAKLAVCTNKREELTYPLLAQLELGQWFDCIVCRDSLPVCKPDPLPLLTCCKRTGATRGIMVGDTTTDLIAAESAGMPCLLASFGYGTFDQADKIKARFFGHFEELPGLISEIVTGR